jgi:hypothetical protein
LYHHSDRERAENAVWKRSAPHTIAPTPPMMSTGLDALFEPLATTTTPTTVAVAPTIPITDARKLFDL